MTVFLRQKLGKDDATVTVTNSGLLWGLTMRSRTSRAWSHLILMTKTLRNKTPILQMRKWRLTEDHGIHQAGEHWNQHLTEIFLTPKYVELLILLYSLSQFLISDSAKVQYKLGISQSLVISQVVSRKEITRINSTGWNKLVYTLNLITKDKAVWRHLFF